MKNQKNLSSRFWIIMMLGALGSCSGSANALTKEECESRGGTWAAFGMLQQEQCDFPTKDSGKQCADSSQCESICIAAESLAPGTPTEGTCYGRTVTLGTCLNRVSDGRADGTLCED